MGILQNYDEGNMDALRSIKYSETGTQTPYVVKDIKNPPSTGNAVELQINSRIDDTTRIAKMLIDKPGLKFASNQFLLEQGNIKRKAKAAADKKRNQKGGATAAGVLLAGAAGAVVGVAQAAGQVLKVIGSTLAQVPVNGTGTHFLRGFNPDTYIKTPNASGVISFLGLDGVNGAARALNGEPIIIDNDGSPGNYLYPSDIKDRQSKFNQEDVNTYSDIGGFISGSVDTDIRQVQALSGSIISVGPTATDTKTTETTASTGSFGVSNNVPEADQSITGDTDTVKPFEVPGTKKSKDTTKVNATTAREGKDPIPLIGQETETTAEIERSKPNTVTGSYDSDSANTTLEDFRQGSYSFDYTDSNINKETRVGLGNQGAKKQKDISYNFDNKLEDKINAQDTITKTNPTDGSKASDPDSRKQRDLIKFSFDIITPEDTTFLYFRAFLTQFDDNYQGSWNTTKYLGRAEEMYTYQGFSRSISIGFTIAAATRKEMKPLYRKMAALASVTAPTYGGDDKYMRGTIARATVGDYIYNVPGIIESVSYTWNTSYNWEIAFQNPEGKLDDDMQELPQAMDCSITFKPIHDFIPQAVGKDRLLPYITNPIPNGSEKAIFIK
tara:strand:+ start:3346 stop:5181 length:1836 start_codon:yes stop_codon:yes gene_type:complete